MADLSNHAEPDRESTLIAASRDRRRRPLEGRDRIASLLLAASFLALAVVLQVLAPARIPVLTGLLLVGVYLVASRVEFEIGAGVALASELVIVPMFLLLPPASVPLLIAACTLVHRGGEIVRRQIHPQRAFVLLASCWYTLGPAVVLQLAGHQPASWKQAPIYAAALAAQIALDFSSAVARETFGHRQPLLQIARATGWAYLVDLLLAPIGLLVALAAANRPYVLLLLIAPCALLAVLARDRSRRIEHALQLTQRFDHASRQANEDSLTGLANRRAWDEAIREFSSDDDRSDRAHSIILIDLDQLKETNDSFGHAVGDQMISDLAGLIAGTIREDGLVARIGGDEIGVLLPSIDELGCQAIVRRLRDNLRHHPDVGPVPLTASLGHATTIPPAIDLLEALRLADKRMYVNKQTKARSRGAPGGLESALVERQL